jgi:membrane protease YdiL (CAAX protease family)
MQVIKISILIASTDILQGFTVAHILVGIIGLTGVGLLINWGVSTQFSTLLDDCPVRRNRLWPGLSFGVIIFWQLMVVLGISVVGAISDEASSWVADFANYLWMLIVELLIIALALYLGREYFARRIKGLGLDFRTLTADLKAGFVNFLAAYPLVIAGSWLMVFAGGLISGDDFQFDTSEGLLVLAEYPSILLRVVVVVFIVIVTPFFEEIVFRGLLQSSIAGFVSRRWMAIVLASLLFTALHPWTHCLAIFPLSCVIGYSYEKSGSLLRPIVIHMLFNGFNVAASLLGG